MKTIQTVTAILMAIQSFGTTKFSIWDITKVIRKNLNDSVYLLDTSHPLDHVYHDDVKELFLELLENGILVGVNETHNPNGYREYQFGVASPTTITQAQTTPTAVVQSAMASTNIPVDVQKKIYSYLKNNGPATPKMIQSRLKGHPYTCKDIYEFLNNINLMEDSDTSTLPVSYRFTKAI